MEKGRGAEDVDEKFILRMKKASTDGLRSHLNLSSQNCGECERGTQIMFSWGDHPHCQQCLSCSRFK
jgi:hypothetical protein